MAAREEKGGAGKLRPKLIIGVWYHWLRCTLIALGTPYSETWCLVFMRVPACIDGSVFDLSFLTSTVVFSGGFWGSYSLFYLCLTLDLVVEVVWISLW